MGAINGVMNGYSGQLGAIGLGPLRLYYVGRLWFWKGACQAHISTRESADHFCLCKDFRLALKTKMGPLSVQVMFKQSFLPSCL